MSAKARGSPFSATMVSPSSSNSTGCRGGWRRRAIATGTIAEKAAALARRWYSSFAMRFAVLGPAHDDLVALEKGASLVLFELEAEEVIYLGADDALDRLVWDWARRLVGPDPSEEGLWARAAQRCGPGSPDAIDRFIAAERRRARLKALKCLLAATSRTIEIIDGRVAVLLYDKALLDEEDILPASLLIFGKSQEPVVRQVGSRTFIS